jgi:type VI secretion system secreted protein VgrG
LAGREQILGVDHPDTVRSVNNLAALYQDKGDTAAAEPLFRRALAGFEEALGHDHPETLTGLETGATRTQTETPPGGRAVMPDYTQANRRIRVTTALGPDALLLTGFRGTEGLSRLFQFELDLVAPVDTPADFAKILGQPAVIEIDLPNGQPRFFHGIVNRFAQGHKDDTFIHYRAEVVPLLWLLTRRERSRIFQHKTAKEILTVVLDGIPLDWRVRDTQATRDYCTQYRESDFAFASRLMEDEGMYYYFAHTADKHTLVVSDHPDGHDKLPVEPTLEYEPTGGGEGAKKQFLITSWEKVQELRTGKVTLWDHHFELPHQPLDAAVTIQGSVAVGTVTHDLRAGNVTQLEKYDYPGGYADWFDGVDPGGAPSQSGDLKKIFEQNRRIATLRVQEEAAAAVTLRGTSPAGHLTAGHKFTLTKHYDADGDYILTEVSHSAAADGDYRSGAADYRYDNTFTCLPTALPYRPARTTPRPAVKGSQTAVVVGPAGEEIFTDPYGRVKVQFHWDREGKHDANSSCWIRVSTIWAGKGWGVIHIPRIGHEVIVDFLEGDPDRPIILGSVYNADHIPPGALPKEGMVSGLQSRSTPKGGGSNFNGMRANDTKGKESLTVQAEYDMTTLVKHDTTIDVLGKHTETIKKDTSITVSEGNLTHDVAKGTAFYHVKGAFESKYEATSMATVTGAVTEHYNDSLETIVKNGIHIASTAAHIYIHTATSIQLHVGDSSIWMDSGGQIAIKGNNIAIEGKESVSIHGGMVRSKADSTHEIESGGNCKSAAGGTNTVKGSMVMLNPD